MVRYSPPLLEVRIPVAKAIWGTETNVLYWTRPWTLPAVAVPGARPASGASVATSAGSGRSGGSAEAVKNGRSVRSEVCSRKYFFRFEKGMEILN